MIKIIGNAGVVGRINIAAKAAVGQNSALPHMLLTGPAGCGKTSTAKYIAAITGVKLISCAYDAVRKRADLFQIVEKMDDSGYNKYGKKTGPIKPSILFIDEIHGLSVTAQEFLGIMMEEHTLQVDVKEIRNTTVYLKNKVEAGSEKEVGGFVIWVPEFTLIGATTNDGLLTKPFQTRFKLRLPFSTYSVEDSCSIVQFHASRLGIKIEPDAIVAIAKRGRGVGRTLVNLLESCRDFAIYSNTPAVTEEVVRVNFQEIGIDEGGFTTTDDRILKILNDNNAPVGIDNLAVILNESPKVLTENVEPYLIQMGLVMRTPRGRLITDKGRQHLMAKGLIDPEEAMFNGHLIPKTLYQSEDGS